MAYFPSHTNPVYSFTLDSPQSPSPSLPALPWTTGETEVSDFKWPFTLILRPAPTDQRQMHVTAWQVSTLPAAHLSSSKTLILSFPGIYLTIFNKYYFSYIFKKYFLKYLILNIRNSPPWNSKLIVQDKF